MSEMKPCPFCGGTKICTEKGINLNYCDNCSAESNVEHWNTRPIEDALNKRIAELEKALNIDTDLTIAGLRKELRDATTRIAELEGKIDQLTAHSDIERQDDKSSNDVATPIDVALRKRIAKLEAERRWRVVADGELPEVYRDEDGEFIPFLVCEGDGDRPFIAMYGGINWHAGIFVPDITHWMPLPELPEVK